MEKVTLCGKPNCRGCPVVTMVDGVAIITDDFDGKTIELARLKI